MSNLQNGGAERSLVNLLQLLDYTKYEVDLLLFQDIGMFLKQVPKEVNVISSCTDLHILYSDNFKKNLFKIEYFHYNILRLISTAMSKIVVGKSLKHKQVRWKYFYKYILKRLPETYDVAVAYLHGEQFYYLVDKVDAIRKIGWVHNEYTKSGLSAELDLPYFEQIEKIVTISEVCADVLKETFPTQQEKIMVLPNLTSADIIKRMAQEFYPSEYIEGKLKFVSIGRLHPQKGFDIAIEVASILKNKGIQFVWYILGSGALKEELEVKRAHYQVEDCIKFIGSRENPYPYLQHADIVVQPSRFEGKSIVLDEAKILAKPIVVTAYTTVYDQISDKEGLIVDISAEKIACGIEKMINSKLREQYSKYLAEHNYSNEHELKGYELLFDTDGKEKKL